MGGYDVWRLASPEGRSSQLECWVCARSMKHTCGDCEAIQERGMCLACVQAAQAEEDRDTDAMLAADPEFQLVVRGRVVGAHEPQEGEV